MKIGCSRVIGVAVVMLVGCGGGSAKPPGGGTGGAGGGGTSTGGGSGGTGVNTCGFSGEVEPNETRDMATPYTFGTAMAGCVASSADHDFYEFTAPVADLAGGYIQITLTDVG